MKTHDGLVDKMMDRLIKSVPPPLPRPIILPADPDLGLDSIAVTKPMSMSPERAAMAYDCLQEILGSCSESERNRLTLQFLGGRTLQPVNVERSTTIPKQLQPKEAKTC